MPGMHETWNPYKTHVQGGLREGNFLNGQFVLICAGPPHLSDIGASSSGGDTGADICFPIGLTQNIAISQNKAISRIFEIGSERSYFITGRSVGQLSLSRIVYHGPSLLKCLYAYYGTNTSVMGDDLVDPLFSSAALESAARFPFAVEEQGKNLPGSSVSLQSGVHGVRIPPGYENMYLNLASDLFSQPIGLYLIFKDNNESSVASVYLEQCYVPTHSLALSSQGLIIQESVGIQYERIVPVKSASVRLVSGILPDEEGSGSF